jgi:hypothetical protein
MDFLHYPLLLDVPSLLTSITFCTLPLSGDLALFRALPIPLAAAIDGRNDHFEYFSFILFVMLRDFTSAVLSPS